jgi:hypothetical protein
MSITKKLIIYIIFFSVLSACNTLQESPPSIDKSVNILLENYSKTLSDLDAFGTLNHAWFSYGKVSDLIFERQHFYRVFFQVALHSQLTEITSTFDKPVITQDKNDPEIYYIEAGEILNFKGIYLSRQVCLVQATYWALENASDRRVHSELSRYFNWLLNDMGTIPGDSFETGWVIFHKFTVQNTETEFKVLKDIYTDINPQDNPDGIDVIDWKENSFERKPVDLTQFPDYQKYQSCIESESQNILNNYIHLYSSP